MNIEHKKDKLSHWSPEQEELLAEWAEKASGYRWLHSRSEKLYRKRNYRFTIPVIILSTLTGTANFAMDSFVPEEHKQIAMACVGGVNIFAGILSTLQNFLRYAELMEGHRVSEVSWSKFSREISVELALNPKMRKPAVDFLNVCRAEYDRLIEQSPTIDDSIISQYKRVFKNIDIHHPHVCNGLHKCKIYELSTREKTANIVANAGEILKNSTIHHIRDKRHNIHNTSENTHNHHITEITHKYINPNEIKNENMKELNDLKGIGKVSGLKSKINGERVYNNHQEEIKSIIKNNDIKDNIKDTINDNIKDKGVNNDILGEDIIPPLYDKKNIKLSINVEDDNLEEGEYELFKGSLNKKDKKNGGDIFLINKMDDNMKGVEERIVEDVNYVKKATDDINGNDNVNDDINGTEDIKEVKDNADIVIEVEDNLEVLDKDDVISMNNFLGEIK